MMMRHRPGGVNTGFTANGYACETGADGGEILVLSYECCIRLNTETNRPPHTRVRARERKPRTTYDTRGLDDSVLIDIRES